MTIRQARKILCGRLPKRMRKRLQKRYPPYVKDGVVTYPSWHRYHRIARAWVVVHRKINKYGDKFKLL